MTAARKLAAAGLAAAVVAAAAARAPAGRYRLEGKAHVEAKPVLQRDVDVAAIAELAPLGTGGALRLRLTSEGYGCDLTARAAADGALAIDPGQRCALKLDRPTVRGDVEAQLQAARGRIEGKQLTLETTWALSGAVSMRLGGQRYEVMGREVDIPAAWGPNVPVRGTAQVRADGPRIEVNPGVR